MLTKKSKSILSAKSIKIGEIEGINVVRSIIGPSRIDLGNIPYSYALIVSGVFIKNELKPPM